MTTVAQFRKAALALPEVEEGARFGRVAFRVRGKPFASVGDNGTIHLSMAHDDAERTLARVTAAEPLTRAGKRIGVSVPRAAVNGMELNALVVKAWSSRAPKRLVAAWREASRGRAPAGPDALPKSIGKPATQALLVAGVRSLTDVAGRTEAELLALHGVGPKAVRLLGEALAERGLAFGRDDAEPT